MSPTEERDRASRLAGADEAATLRIARGIDDAWFRCQALAHVAWTTPDPARFFERVAESMASGWSIEDPNRSATVIAWPVAALAARMGLGPDEGARADRELAEAIARVTSVVARAPSAASRGDALLWHVHALSPFRPGLRRTVLERLVEACRDPSNRKRQHQLERAVLAIAPDDPETAMSLAGSLDLGRRLRTTASIEGRRQGLGPWRFFEASDAPR